MVTGNNCVLKTINYIDPPAGSERRKKETGPRKLPWLGISGGRADNERGVVAWRAPVQAVEYFRRRDPRKTTANTGISVA